MSERRTILERMSYSINKGRFAAQSDVEAEKSIEIKVDKTPPLKPTVLDDGAYTNSTTQLHAWWTSDDPESGIQIYEYAIGTSPGDDDVVKWTSESIITSGNGSVDEMQDGPILDETNMIENGFISIHWGESLILMKNRRLSYPSGRIKNFPFNSSNILAKFPHVKKIFYSGDWSHL